MDYYCCIELVEVVGLHDLEEKKKCVRVAQFGQSFTYQYGY